MLIHKNNMPVHFLSEKNSPNANFYCHSCGEFLEGTYYGHIISHNPLRTHCFHESCLLKHLNFCNNTSQKLTCPRCFLKISNSDRLIRRIREVAIESHVDQTGSAYDDSLFPITSAGVSFPQSIENHSLSHTGSVDDLWGERTSRVISLPLSPCPNEDPM